MLVRMLETTAYTEDGHTIKRAYKGELLDVAEHAARDMFRNKKAIQVIVKRD